MVLFLLGNSLSIGTNAVRVFCPAVSQSHMSVYITCCKEYQTFSLTVQDTRFMCVCGYNNVMEGKSLNTDLYAVKRSQ